MPIVSPAALAAHATSSDPWAEKWFANNVVGDGPVDADRLPAHVHYNRDAEPPLLAAVARRYADLGVNDVERERRRLGSWSCSRPAKWTSWAPFHPTTP